jgi:hypothetical protein
MIKIQTVVLVLLLCLFSLPMESQMVKVPDVEIETHGYASTGKMLPFWFVSNEFGQYSADLSGNLTTLKLHSNTDNATGFGLNYGLEVANRFTGDNDFWLHQGYIDLTYLNFFRLSAGVWEETLGNQYKPLSSGSIVWSGNARPLPKVEVGTAGYVKVPFTRGKLETMASLAHGWFEADRHVENVWLHQKYIYFRTSWDFPLAINYGFHHFAMWGGVSPRHGKLPVNLDSYRRVFFVQSGGEDAPEGWQINKFGNHIGSRHLGLDWESTNNTVGVYYQDVFEDGSGRRRENFPDGLWGIYYETNDEHPLVKAFLYELLYTANQSGPVHHYQVGLTGEDNYFNHGVYGNGWTTHQMVIGTPFITSPAFNYLLFNADEPVNIDFKLFNNRVSVHHAAVMGCISEQLQYKLAGSFSRNMGLHNYSADSWRPEVFKIYAPRKQWSWRGDIKYLWRKSGIESTVSVAVDRGEMYGDNAGVMLGLKYILPGK